MITIQHTHVDSVIITYSNSTDNCAMKEETRGRMDELSEHMCDMMYSHNFNRAYACSDSNGEILIKIERT